MSAKSAAEALITNDPHLAERVRELELHDLSYIDRCDAVENLLRETIGTWTLTLAAQAASATEEQVIAAMAYHPALRIGSICVARGLAKRLFDSGTLPKAIAQPGDDKCLTLND